MELLSQPGFTVSRLVVACFVPAGSGQHTHQNRPSHGFAIRVNGKVIYHFADGTDLVNGTGDGDVVYLPKYSSYWVECLEPGDCYAINFDLTEDLHCQPFVHTFPDPERVLEYFRCANRSWQSQNPGFREACLGQLYAVFSELLADIRPVGDAAILSPAISYIHEHYARDIIAVPELAALCDISEAWLRQLFRRVYGQSPIEYIRKLRLTRAAELIDSGMCSVRDAAALSGFLDDSYFSREFKKKYGLSPRAYKSRTE